MLRELRIQNLAVIEAVEVRLHPGLNVLTGETGAGKSILIDAILLLRGGRAQTDLIRAGAEVASVEAVFEIGPASPLLAVLDDVGFRPDGVEGSADVAELFVRRELSRTGRHRAFVNDSPVTVALLERLGDHLVEVHGQHEHQRLLEPAHQLELLDRFAAADELRRTVATLFDARQAARHAVEDTRAAERERAQREDLLRFQVSEIDAARLTAGEEEALRSERARLGNAERFTSGLNEAAAGLYDDPRSATALLARAAQVLRELGRLDTKLAAPCEHVDAALSHVEEAVGDIRRLRDGLTFEPERLEAIEDRLDALGRLKRKYGDSVEAVLAFRKEIGAALDALTRHAEVLATQEAALAAVESELERATAELSAKRRVAAGRLATQTQRGLRELGMERAVFEVALEPLEVPTASGRDRMEFRVALNPGEGVKPLARVASGGELARSTLALKTVLADDDRMPTMVFDEVDAGIGGRVADIVGGKLAAISRGRQVLCVTHVAQIAAHADWHLTVAKAVRGGRTRTTVEPLEASARVDEIARMLGGEIVTDTGRRHARELLAAARAARPDARPAARRV
jgi:DNA repair protein RecN (Recombination protein N)